MFRFRSPARQRTLVIMAMLCVSLWSFGALDATSARYVTARTGRVEARVASFLVEAGTPELRSTDATLDCNTANDSVVYAFTVRNRSEVDVIYAVSAEGVSDSVLLTVSPASGELAANSGTQEVTLAFTARDPSDRTQALTAGNVMITVTALQKGGSQ